METATKSQRLVMNRCDFEMWVQMAPDGVHDAWTRTFVTSMISDLGLKSDFRLNRVYIPCPGSAHGRFGLQSWAGGHVCSLGHGLREIQSLYGLVLALARDFLTR